MRGFTFVELLIVIGLTVILAVGSLPIYSRYQVSAQLNETSAQITQTLRLARQKSVSGTQGGKYGVFFEYNIGNNDRYIMYKGTSYTTRNSTFDRVMVLDNALSFGFMNFDLIGDDVDVNFDKGTGLPDNTGDIVLFHSSGGSRQININEIGKIEEE